MYEWIVENLGWVMGLGGIGGLAAVLRKLVPGFWGLVVNAGSAPYYKGTTEVAERLLEIKTQGEARALAEAERLANDYDKLLEVNRGLRRSIAALQDSHDSSPASSPSTSPPSNSDPPSAKPSKRRDPANS